ncbi:MAG TPA: ATP-binding protein [Hypericibacter adhaerens]|uniref:endopeptidase La n=1 Tax=Hypericibacter adhaerens TaxID=2602016 RepID=A0A5J6MXJ4_9PROT|nr:ATP-binding protein [Hypericibacter adhaerens]QEX22031.1 ATP-dependent protease [Hypericibacter adhaerens]HWA46311.1 ATP-binding protein [Hypericibacter adhaerens]
MAGPITPLKPEALYRHCDETELPFQTTAELKDIHNIVGQERALDALEFGIGIRRQGYNLYALGPGGTGKHTIAFGFLHQRARSGPVPPDLCYVNNFDVPYKPIALRLPAGRGSKLQAEMRSLIDDLRVAIPALLESEDYRNRRQLIDEATKNQQAAVFEGLQAKAEPKGIALLRTPMGFAFAPVRDGAALSPEEFQKLSEADRKRIETDLKALQEELEEELRKFPQMERQRRDQARELDRQVTSAAVANGIASVRDHFRDLPDVVGYLDAVEKDIVDNADAFLPSDGETPAVPGAVRQPPAARDRFRRYRVNLLVDHTHQVGSPVIYEDNPTMPNLVGRVENLAELGALITDFTLIKAGALHRANGGYLMLDAQKLLTQPYAYEALKRALRARSITIESPGQALSLVSTVSVEPEPVHLDVKIVIVGSREIYYLLASQDPEFNDLFKVAADFDDDMPREEDAIQAYARLIATIGRREGLKTFDRGAVARLIEQAGRIADDNQKLTTRFGDIADLMREGDYWADKAKRDVIGADDIETAIDQQMHRSGRIRERSLEVIDSGIVLIDTAGSKVGQINGLSVLSLPNFSFGKPSRITARVRLGRGEVIDVERRVELGGPTHSKGVLILSAFLAARYASDQPLSLSATLVFEQSYGGVDGDSASSAELYALLSALSELPIDQSFAVTGSVNQFGQVQAIGGVNEKIEGYFDVCRHHGLTGKQGVLIPASNVRHLMLRRDIIEAARKGQFRIFPVETIDQGIEILTGFPAGAREDDGKFPKGSVNRRVEDRLIALAQQRRRFGAGDGAETGQEGRA